MTIIYPNNLNFAIVLDFYHKYEIFNKIGNFKFLFEKDNPIELTVIIKCIEEIFMTMNELNKKWTLECQNESIVTFTSFIITKMKRNFYMFGIKHMSQTTFLSTFTKEK